MNLLALTTVIILFAFLSTQARRPKRQILYDAYVYGGNGHAKTIQRHPPT